ncbi:MAG: Ldh family oxidoreductase [Candidatus Doudnabacteria bacterium]|nr:Ldh family oxidoreductase [Candidatus Doudnabacteria bacterium]
MRIDKKKLVDLCVKALVKRRLSTNQAKLVVDEFLDAELRGQAEHGFFTFPQFVSKLTVPQTKPKILKETNNLLYIDGQGNFGQVVCNQYVPKLISKARRHNIAIMGIVNMRSYQMPGTYARLAAQNNLVAFVFNYGGGSRVAPFGSIDPILGANPIAIGLPSKNFPVVLDMSTSKVAAMNIRLATLFGRRIPLGIAMDKSGKPTRDPRQALAGAILPFGEYKGSGLALILELLTRAMFGLNLSNKTKTKRGYVFILFNPIVFGSIEKFKKANDLLIKQIKNSRRAKGIKEIFVPGERGERLKKLNSKKDFIVLDRKIVEDIKALL